MSSINVKYTSASKTSPAHQPRKKSVDNFTEEKEYFSENKKTALKTRLGNKCSIVEDEYSNGTSEEMFQSDYVDDEDYKDLLDYFQMLALERSLHSKRLVPREQPKLDSFPPEVVTMLKVFTKRAGNLLKNAEIVLEKDKDRDSILKNLAIVAAEPMKLLQIDLSLFQKLSSANDQQLIKQMKNHAEKINNLITIQKIEKDAITQACGELIKIQANEFSESLQIRIAGVVQANMQEMRGFLQGVVGDAVQKGIKDGLAVQDVKYEIRPLPIDQTALIKESYEKKLVLFLQEAPGLCAKSDQLEEGIIAQLKKECFFNISFYQDRSANTQKKIIMQHIAQLLEESGVKGAAKFPYILCLHNGKVSPLNIQNFSSSTAVLNALEFMDIGKTLMKPLPSTLESLKKESQEKLVVVFLQAKHGECPPCDQLEQNGIQDIKSRQVLPTMSFYQDRSSSLRGGAMQPVVTSLFVESGSGQRIGFPHVVLIKNSKVFAVELKGLSGDKVIESINAILSHSRPALTQPSSQHGRQYSLQPSFQEEQGLFEDSDYDGDDGDDGDDGEDGDDGDELLFQAARPISSALIFGNMRAQMERERYAQQVFANMREQRERERRAQAQQLINLNASVRGVNRNGTFIYNGNNREEPEESCRQQ